MPVNPPVPKILYVEGHSAVRDVYANLLAYSANFTIDIARNGIEGVQKAERWQPDLILMGLRMPRMDGFEVIRYLRQCPATAHTPIIVLSAWESASHRQRALAAGADTHLAIPIETDRLIAAIRRFLEKQEAKSRE